MTDIATITLPMMREHFYSAVVSDALDGLGFKRQSPRLPFIPYTGTALLDGRCKTTLWVDMAPSAAQGEVIGAIRHLAAQRRPAASSAAGLPDWRHNFAWNP